MNAHERQELVLSRMRQGAIRHDLLPDDLLAVIAAVHRRIGRYLGVNLEQFEIGLMRTESPETEVAVWNTIAMAWDKFQQKYVDQFPLPQNEKKALIAALVAISMGVQKPELLGVPVRVGIGLLACFDEVLGP